MDLLRKDARRQRFCKYAPVLRVCPFKIMDKRVDDHKLVAGKKDHELRIVDVAEQVGHIVYSRYGKGGASGGRRIPGRVKAVFLGMERSCQ